MGTAAAQPGPQGPDALTGPGPGRRDEGDTGDADADHEALVRVRSAELTRLAYLVTGDRERSIALVAAALVDLREEWPEVIERGTPQAEARTAVARRLLPRRRRGAPGDTSPVFAPAGTPDPDDEPPAYGLDDDELDPAVLRAYAALPPTTRLALVLSELDHLDGPAVAAILDSDLPDVDAATGSGLDHIGRERARAADDAGRDRPSVGIASHLRQVLIAQCARAALPTDLTQEVAGLRDRRVRRRRLLTAGVGGLGLAAIGALAGPAVLGGRDDGRLRSAGTSGASSTGTSTLDGGDRMPVALSWDAIWRWPARGSMLADPRVRAVSRLDPARRVIYAERLNGITLVVSAAHDDNGTDSSGLPDPLATLLSIGVAADRGTSDSPSATFGVTGTDPFAVVTSRYGPGRLVLLGRPEVRSVEVSTTVRFAPDGTRVRTGWKALQLEQGMGQVGSPAAGSFGMAVRYAGHHFPPYSTSFAETGQFHPGGVTARGGVWVADQILAALTARVRDTAAVLTGLAPAEVSVAVSSRTPVRAGAFEIDVPSGPDGTAEPVYPAPDSEVAVLIAALPGGARLRTVAAWHPRVVVSPVPSVYLAEESVPYPAERLDRRPVVLTGSGNSPEVGILAPRATSVRLSGVHLGPGQKATLPLSGGIATFRLAQYDEAATTTTLDATGRATGQWPLFPDIMRDAWDLYG